MYTSNIYTINAFAHCTISMGIRFLNFGLWWQAFNEVKNVTETKKKCFIPTTAQ